MASEIKLTLLAEGAKSRRRKVLQNRLQCGNTVPAKLLTEFEGESWVELGPRPLVNPKATAIKQDEQLQVQQAWDKQWKAVSAPEAIPVAPEPVSRPETHSSSIKHFGD